MTKQMTIKTSYPVISIMITYDSTRVITVTKKNDRTYFISQFDL